MKPIVFLDCDGVLNHTQMSWRSEDGRFIIHASDPACVKRLQRFVEEVDAKIVISSTWRLLNEKEDIISYLGEWIRDRLHDDWRTTRDYDRLRGNQINEWLEKNGNHPYVILDDDSDFHDYQPLIKTSHDTGLTDADIIKCHQSLEDQLVGHS